MMSEDGLSERWGNTRYVLRTILWTAECLGPNRLAAEMSNDRSVMGPIRIVMRYAHVQFRNHGNYRFLMLLPEFNVGGF